MHAPCGGVSAVGSVTWTASPGTSWQQAPVMFTRFLLRWTCLAGTAKADREPATTTNATHTFAARRSYTVKLTDVDGTQSSSASVGVNCNRRNCS